MRTFRSPNRHRSRWAHCNTPDALRRRRAAADARREAMAEAMPPVYAGPEPLSVWQTIEVRDGTGTVQHRITLYVPTHGRCDQHAAEIDGSRCDRMLTATSIGEVVAGWVRKRPSPAELREDRC